MVLTPKKAPGVYQDKRGGWYIKYDLGVDPATGRRVQVTKRGFHSAGDAAEARRELMGKVDRGALRPGRSGMTVDQLLDLFLDGMDADRRLGAKTRFDYRH